MAIAKYYSGEYQSAIDAFKTAEKSSYFKKSAYINVHLYDWISKSYDSLRQIDSAHHYNKIREFVEKQQKQLEHSRAIKRIESEHNVREKEKELTKLSKTLSKNLCK